MNQQCLVDKFKCDLCDAGYVGFSNFIDFIDWQAFSRPAFFGPRGSTKNFSVLKMCTNKFDCLLYEMFFLKNRDLLSMCSRTQFVQRFLIRFSSLLSLLFVFLLSVYKSKNFTLLTCI